MGDRLLFDAGVVGSLKVIDTSRGKLRLFAGTNPAANTECQETVPAGKAWHVRSVMVACVQGATNTPLVTLTVDDGATVFEQFPGSTTVQAINTTCTYTWAPGLSPTAQIGLSTGVVSLGPLPRDGLWLPAGFRISTLSPGKGSNTDFGAPLIYVAEFDLS
jgi:hypothetical protein